MFVRDIHTGYQQSVQCACSQGVHRTIKSVVTLLGAHVFLSPLQMASSARPPHCRRRQWLVMATN
jgi:hypothetical protein